MERHIIPLDEFKIDKTSKPTVSEMLLSHDDTLLYVFIAESSDDRLNSCYRHLQVYFVPAWKQLQTFIVPFPDPFPCSSCFVPNNAVAYIDDFLLLWGWTDSHRCAQNDDFSDKCFNVAKLVLSKSTSTSNIVVWDYCTKLTFLRLY
jgi:hypothetical protein